MNFQFNLFLKRIVDIDTKKWGREGNGQCVWVGNVEWIHTFIKTQNSTLKVLLNEKQGHTRMKSKWLR